MRVLWYSCTPSCYDVQAAGGWVEALEKIVRTYLPQIELGICFEYKRHVGKEVRDGVCYYPIKANVGFMQKLTERYFPSPRAVYERLRPLYMEALEDFNPDIVQCFGTELWHYSLLTREVKVPFVVHIMGFWNIYRMMGEVALHSNGYGVDFNLRRKYAEWRAGIAADEHAQMERDTMACCRYYMGRTEWDKSLVKAFSPQSVYYHCPEAIREEVYSPRCKWRFRKDNVIRIVTVSNAGNLKGNEIMLRAAWLLTHRFQRKVEWVYTSDKSRMAIYERVTGIDCDDVGIKLIGRVGAKQIPSLLCNAEFFVHSSIIDNSPNAICEAQLMGIPVISSNSGGIPQMIEDGVTGFLYPYSEPYALALKIMSLHNDEATLTRISEQERERSHERHHPQQLANRLFAIYNDVLNSFSKKS